MGREAPGERPVVCPFCKRRMRFRKTAGEWIEDRERPPFHILYQKRLLLCPERFKPR